MVLDLLEAADEGTQLQMCDDILAVDGVVGLFLADLFDGFEDLLELVAADAQRVIALLHLQFAN